MLISFNKSILHKVQKYVHTETQYFIFNLNHLSIKS